MNGRGRLAYERNLRVYGWVKIFTKRVYLPLISIYLVEVGGLNVAQLAWLVVIAAVTSILINFPAGYLADRWSRRGTLILGAGMLAIACGMFVLYPQFPGAVVATIIESLGYSVLNGSAGALVHDSLVALGRERDYAKVSGRAQSFGLIGNVILVTLVPMTYVVDKRLPFVCGIVAALAFMFVASRLVEPPRPSHADLPLEQPSLQKLFRLFVTRRTVLFFVVLGLMGAAYNAYAPISNLTIVDTGFPAAWLGTIFGISSILGAFLGWHLHRLQRLSLLQYSLLDVWIGFSFLLAIGLTRSAWVAAIMFIINMGFWRVRSILYQHYMLEEFTRSHYKASLMSLISLFESVHLWMPLVFAAIVARQGYYDGFIVISIASIICLSSLYWLAVRRLQRA